MKLFIRSFGAAALLLAAATAQAQTSLTSYFDSHETAACESCGSESLCDCCCGGGGANWVVGVGAVILHRSGPSFTTAGGQAITASDDFNWVGGPDIYVAGRMNDRDWLQFRHFNVQGWGADYTLDDDGTVYDGSYGSRLYSTELNLRRQQTDNLGLIAGFRWIELHEAFNNELPDFQYGTNTSNHLYGAQVGGDAALWTNGPFRLDSWAKLGLYGTHATGHFTNSVGFDENVAHGAVSFVGDVAFNGSYQVTERVSFRAGYQLLWIEGVAGAGDQLQFSTTPPPLTELDRSSGLFAHGLLLGVDLVW